MSIRAGFAKRDITPKKPVLLRGQFNRRRATEKDDPLYATALCVKHGGDAVIWLSVDMTAVPRDTVLEIARGVEECTKGFSQSGLMLSATHTHTAPYLTSDSNVEGWGECFRLTDDVLWDCQRPEEYRDTVFIPGCIEAAREAFENAEECIASAACEYAVIGHPRRARYKDGSSVMYGETMTESFSRLEGGADNAVMLAFFHSLEGKPLGAVVNVNCPAQIWEHGERFSADYIGAFREMLSKTEIDMPCVTVIGNAGNIAPRDLLRHRERFMTPPIDSFPYMYGKDGVTDAGERLFEAFERGYRRRKAVGEGFYYSMADIDLPVFTVTKDEYEASKKQYDSFVSKYGCGIYTAPDMEKMLSSRHAGVVNRYERQVKCPCCRSRVHILAIGDMVFATNPFELYNTYGLRMIATSPFAYTFTAEITSGYEGYLPTEEAVKAKSYSATVSDCTVRGEGGDILTEYTVCEINKAHNKIKSY